MPLPFGFGMPGSPGTTNPFAAMGGRPGGMPGGLPLPQGAYSSLGGPMPAAPPSMQTGPPGMPAGGTPPGMLPGAMPTAGGMTTAGGMPGAFPGGAGALANLPAQNPFAAMAGGSVPPGGGAPGLPSPMGGGAGGGLAALLAGARPGMPGSGPPGMPGGAGPMGGGFLSGLDRLAEQNPQIAAMIRQRMAAMGGGAGGQRPTMPSQVPGVPTGGPLAMLAQRRQAMGGGSPGLGAFGTMPTGAVGVPQIFGAMRPGY